MIISHFENPDLNMQKQGFNALQTLTSSHYVLFMHEKDQL